jgi:hypothetical protein
MVPAFLEINCLFSGTSVASVADIEAGLSPTARVARGQRKDLVMGKAQLHVVFGTGQVGNALAAHLAGLAVADRAVSRPRPAELAGSTDWQASDFFGPGVTQGPVASPDAR